MVGASYSSRDLSRPPVVRASYSSRDLSRPPVVGCVHVMGVSFSSV
jgi:hypothetical protein